MMTFVATYFENDFALMFSDSFGISTGNKIQDDYIKTLKYINQRTKTILIFHFYGSLRFKKNWSYDDFKQNLIAKLDQLIEKYGI